MFPGNRRKDKAVTVMSGSNGGMTLTKQEALFYHKNVITALVLALLESEQTLSGLDGIGE